MSSSMEREKGKWVGLGRVLGEKMVSNMEGDVGDKCFY